MFPSLKSKRWVPKYYPFQHKKRFEEALKRDPNVFEEYFPWILEEYGCETVPDIHRYIPTAFRNSILLSSPQASSKKSSAKKTQKPMKSHSNILKGHHPSKISHLSSVRYHTPSTPQFYIAFDDENKLIDVLVKDSNIPLLLLQCFGSTAGACTKLKKLTFQECTLDPYLLYEMSYICAHSNIKVLDLVDCPSFAQLNYYTLLDLENQLEILSIRRCGVNDECMKIISEKLTFDSAGAQALKWLILSSNHITDVGAKYLADALRTNRTLSHLTLADNKITDLGLVEIMNTLGKFPISYEEVLWKRKDRIYRQSMLDEISPDLGSDTLLRAYTGESLPNFNKGDKDISNATLDYSDLSISYMFNPFQASETELDQGILYCKGNFCLNFLNVAFNRIERGSLKKVFEVLTYQADTIQPYHKETHIFKGLKKLHLEGNNFPKRCSELMDIENLLIKPLLIVNPRKKCTKKH